MYKRLLQLPKNTNKSFFLWGPRQVGKSTLLKASYPESPRIDLLLSDEYHRYFTSPQILREQANELANRGPIIIDEVQKVPQLLDEVHWLIENKGLAFALCGSSARKLKRGHANLLGGRAMRFQMYGLSAYEIGNDLEFLKFINFGYIPNHYLANSEHFPRIIRSYVADYLKEEIAAEGLVRNLHQFSNFLEIASFSDSEPVNFSTIAREVGVSSNTVKEYFSILEDTLQGSWLPSFTKRPKRRITQASKFYFADVGVVNFLSHRSWMEPKTEIFGKAFENWLFHELTCYSEYKSIFSGMSFWRLSTGVEVDFIIGDMQCGIEAKAVSEVKTDHLKNLRELKKDHAEVKKLILVSLDSKDRTTDDGIELLGFRTFLKELWSGNIF